MGTRPGNLCTMHIQASSFLPAPSWKQVLRFQGYPCAESGDYRSPRVAVMLYLVDDLDSGLGVPGSKKEGLRDAVKS
jgi:hypothetical protein